MNVTPVAAIPPNQGRLRLVAPRDNPGRRSTRHLGFIGSARLPYLMLDQGALARQACGGRGC